MINFENLKNNICYAKNKSRSNWTSNYPLLGLMERSSPLNNERKKNDIFTLPDLYTKESYTFTHKPKRR